ncbi:MAG: S8 family peptidase [Patescibacteria group bacterium]
MPTKKPSNRKKPAKLKLASSSRYSLKSMLPFLLVFAVVGTIMLWRTFAATPAGDYIVVLQDNASSDAVADKHAKAYGLEIKFKYKNVVRGYAARIPEARLADLRKNSEVQFISPDLPVELLSQSVGTGVGRVKAVNKANKGSGINVAVIDSGIDTTHPDLAANIAGGTSCSKGGRGYSDGNGHGTHVAGIIAARNNDFGVVGVAPEAKLWAVKVLDDKGAGSISNVICGIDFVDSKSPAKGGPIKVANLSLGSPGTDDGNCGNSNGDALHKSICQLHKDGVAIVAAAGNGGQDLSSANAMVPAAYNEVLAVSALNDSDGAPCGVGAASSYGSDDTLAYFTGYAGSASDQGHMIAAPGVNIYSTNKGGTYTLKTGTSMASPHVAGAAALYIATHLGAAPSIVYGALLAVGEPKNVNFNSECTGSGGRKSSSSGFSHTDPSGRNPEVELRADGL